MNGDCSPEAIELTLHLLLLLTDMFRILRRVARTRLPNVRFLRIAALDMRHRRQSAFRPS